MHDFVTLTSLTPVGLGTRETPSLWVEVRDDHGSTGLGESFPNEGTTAESLTTALAFVDSHRREWRDQVTCVATLTDWAEQHRADIDANPAAWTAVELACLDLLAKNQGCSIERLLGVPELAGRFCYTALLGPEPTTQFAMHLEQLLATGFESFKMTLSGILQDDLARIRLLRDAGVAEARVRAAANQPWSDSCSCVRYVDALGFRFLALEEPVHAANFATLNRVARALDTAIILDASFWRQEQLQEVPMSNQSWIINCRISKMGGLLRCLKMLDALRSCGLRVVVGAHIGESGILARAALTVANAGRDIVLAQEGLFGAFLPCIDVGDLGAVTP